MISKIKSKLKSIKQSTTEINLSTSQSASNRVYKFLEQLPMAAAVFDLEGNCRNEHQFWRPGLVGLFHPFCLDIQKLERTLQVFMGHGFQHSSEMSDGSDDNKQSDYGQDKRQFFHWIPPNDNFMIKDVERFGKSH